MRKRVTGAAKHSLPATHERENIVIEVPNLKNKAVFPNMGHWVNQERATECNKLIIDFLKQP